MADNPIRVLIVGGGITGMAAAYRLQKRFIQIGRPAEILLVDSSAHLGGIIATQRRDGFLLEEGPDCFLTEKPRGVGFCQEIGLEKSLIETQKDARQALLLRRNRLHTVPKGFHVVAPTDLGAMLLSPVLSLGGKFEMLKDFWCPRTTDSDETIGAFVRRRFGQEVLDRLAQPMVSAIYGSDADQMSLQSTFPAISDKDRQGSFFKRAFQKKAAADQAAEAHGARYSLFASFPDGMQTLVHQLGSQMTQVGARLQTSVRMLEGVESGWKALLSSGEELLVDGICLAVPATTAATIVMDMDPELYKLLMKVPYGDSISVYYALKESDIKRQMKGSGFVVPASEKRLISACTFAHRKFAGRAPEGHALLRVFAAGKNANHLWNQTDAYIEKRLFTDLQDILKIKGEPLFTYLRRYRQGLPHYVPGHQERMAAINDHLAALPGFVMAGNWNTGVGIPDCIETGERAAERLLSDLCPS